jgi:hypothetical protein
VNLIAVSMKECIKADLSEVGKLTLKRSFCILIRRT